MDCFQLILFLFSLLSSLDALGIRAGSIGEIELVGTQSILPTNTLLLVKGKNAISSLSSSLSSNCFLEALQMTEIDTLQYQKIVTNNARYITSFTLNNESYVAIAGDTSFLMKWNPTTLNFVFFQNFTQTVGVSVYRWKFFTMTGNRYFLIPAIYATSPTNTTLFEWSTVNQNFNVSQTIAISIRTSAFEYFESVSDKILVAASATEVKSFNFTTSFAFQTSLPAVNVSDIEVALIAGNITVIYSNSSNIYIYQYYNSLFNLYQILNAVNPLAVEIMSFDSNNTYLAVAENSDSAISNRIYKFVNQFFTNFQTISAAAVMDWKYIPFNNENYLALTSFSGNTQIFKFTNLNFYFLGSFTNYGSYCTEKLYIGTTLYLFTGNFNNSSMVYKIVA